jgi:DNA ligase-3
LNCICVSDGYHGDTFLLLKLLLPGVIKAVYNLDNKQIVKLFSKIFAVDVDEMIEDLEQGDVAETAALYFGKSEECPPQKKGTLSLQEVSHS